MATRKSETPPPEPAKPKLPERIVKPEDASARWYLNFLAGNTTLGVPENLMPTVDLAARQWAGAPAGAGSAVAALNIKAGITDPTLYVSMNAALNFIVYGTLNRDECVPWLTDQQALYKLATGV